MPQAPSRWIVACPHCGEVIALEQSAPNIYRQYGWTDGSGLGWSFRNGYPHGRADELYQGYSCGSFFWAGEAEQVHGRRWAITVPKASKNREQLHKALFTAAARNPNQELWIRSRLLWLDNDPVRAVLDPNSKGVQIVRASIRHSGEYKANAARLVELLDIQNPRELLLMAEIFRELGLFQECTALLKDTVEVFFQTQETEAAESRAYTEQFLDVSGSQIIDLRARVESLILMARQVAKAALERDPLVRPVRLGRAVV